MPTLDKTNIPISVNVVQDKNYFNIGNLSIILSNTVGGGIINLIIDLIKVPLKNYISNEVNNFILNEIDTKLSPVIANLWDVINNIKNNKIEEL